MSKFLQTAALVVGAVALVATGVGAIAGAAALTGAAAGAETAASIAITAGTVAQVATYAAIGLSLAASLTAHQPSTGGSPTSWQADPDAGIPICFWRTMNDGKIVYRRAYGPHNNEYETS